MNHFSGYFYLNFYYTVIEANGKVQHPEQIAQDHNWRVSKKVSDNPVDNFKILNFSNRLSQVSNIPHIEIFQHPCQRILMSNFFDRGGKL